MSHRHNDHIFRVGTFNMFNLILPETTYYGRKRYSREDFEQKKAWINHQLLNMQADIVGVQEVFQQEALAEVLRQNPYYKGCQMIVADPVGDEDLLPRVGVISRFPIVAYEVITHFPEKLDVDGVEIPFDRFSRPVLKVRVMLNENQPLTVYVAHRMSKRPSFSDGADMDSPIELCKAQARSLLVRACEANALRTILMDALQHRDHPVVVMGDFNDNHNAVTTQLISGEPPFRYLPMDKKIAQWDTLLYHAKNIQARQSFHDVYYTHMHNGHYESLDHILVSQELVRENPKRVGAVGFVRTFNDHLIDETLSEERMPSWKSDHAQVVATVELNNPVRFLNQPDLG